MSNPHSVRVSAASLSSAGVALGLTNEQTVALWHSLRDSAGPEPAARTDLAHVAWYAGGSVSLLAMSIFLGTGWAQYGAGFGLLITMAYLAGFLVLAGAF